MTDLVRRAFVWAVVCLPFGTALAQTAAPGSMPGGLDRGITVLTTIEGFLRAAAVILVTISLMGTGIAIGFYKKRWEDIAGPVIGGIVAGIAAGVASWLVRGN